MSSTNVLVAREGLILAIPAGNIPQLVFSSESVRNNLKCMQNIFDYSSYKYPERFMFSTNIYPFQNIFLANLAPFLPPSPLLPFHWRHGLNTSPLHPPPHKKTWLLVSNRILAVIVFLQHLFLSILGLLLF